MTCPALPTACRHSTTRQRSSAREQAKRKRGRRIHPSPSKWQLTPWPLAGASKQTRQSLFACRSAALHTSAVWPKQRKRWIWKTEGGRGRAGSAHGPRHSDLVRRASTAGMNATLGEAEACSVGVAPACLPASVVRLTKTSKQLSQWIFDGRPGASSMEPWIGASPWCGV